MFDFEIAFKWNLKSIPVEYISVCELLKEIPKPRQQEHVLNAVQNCLALLLIILIYS
jgi:hypothetical protein